MAHGISLPVKQRGLTARIGDDGAGCHVHGDKATDGEKRAPAFAVCWYVSGRAFVEGLVGDGQTGPEPNQSTDRSMLHGN